MYILRFKQFFLRLSCLLLYQKFKQVNTFILPVYYTRIKLKNKLKLNFNLTINLNYKELNKFFLSWLIVLFKIYKFYLKLKNSKFYNKISYILYGYNFETQIKVFEIFLPSFLFNMKC